MGYQVLGQFQHLQREEVAQRIPIDLGYGIVGQVQLAQAGHVDKVIGLYSLDVVLRQVTGRWTIDRSGCQDEDDNNNNTQCGLTVT